MTQLTTDSPTLRSFATAQRAAAADTDADAARQRSAAIDLAITFGMIGAEFLSAVLHVLELYTQNLETTAQRHHALATDTDRADATYTTRDCDCARDLTARDERTTNTTEERMA